MKILHIGQMIGGLDVYVRNSITYADSSMEFVIACGKDDGNEPVMRNGVPVREYPISLYRQLNPVRDFKSIVEAVRVIRKEKPDAIHCHSAKGGVVGRIAGYFTGVKTFYTPHAFSFLCTPRRFKRWIYLHVERMCKLHSRLLACSESEQEMGIHIVGYREQLSFCWHNCVPDKIGLNEFTPPTHTAERESVYQLYR